MKLSLRPSAPSPRNSATPSSDTFLGSWLVTEYVFNADDSFAGLVHQRRKLHRLENDNIRVTQFCQPDERLADHAMANFAGEWVFYLRVDGKNRHYLGDDVIGMGIQYVDGVMTGCGRWPRFGPQFVSYGFLDGANRQITGGLFHHNGAFVANIIGTAVLEEDGAEWPSINLISAETTRSPLSDIIGHTTYTVWINMLNTLTDDSRIAPLAAGMLRYASQVADVREMQLRPIDIEAENLLLNANVADQDTLLEEVQALYNEWQPLLSEKHMLGSAFWHATRNMHQKHGTRHRKIPSRTGR